MKQSTFHLLTIAARDFAGAAAEIMDSITSTNSFCKSTKAKGCADKFNLSIALSKIERANDNFDRFIKELGISKNDLVNVPTSDNTIY